MYWQMMTAIGAVVAAVIAFAVYIENKKWNTYRYLADLYYEILRVGFSQPDFLDPKKTRKYKDIWPSDSQMYVEYDAYARMCWAHAEDIYNAKSLFFSKKHFRIIYACTFERYRRLHGVWLENNSASFLSPGFLEFVRLNKWRDYLGAREADRLRWDNAADDFDEAILNPFIEGVTNPLFTYIDENFERGKYKVAADLGCGTGKLVGIISEKFERVLGIDYSDNMLEMAKRRCNLPNVFYKKMDMTNLMEVYGEIDIAFSINSILPRHPGDTPIILKEIYKSLKPGGLFVAVLPSFDSVLYLKDLWYKHNIKKLGSKWKAKLETWREFHKRRRLNVRDGLYADDFSNVQRFIHDKEIEPLLRKAGFDLRQKEKVTYPWELCKIYNYGYFPEEEKNIWDWFVVAEKPEIPCQARNDKAVNPRQSRIN